MLEGLPSVMWFIRRQMRSHRARGLSVPQFRTLVQLDRFQKTSLSCVAENLGCSLPTASRMLTNMVRKGLVSRCACSEDRRQVWLGITAKGRAALHDTRAATAHQVALKLAGLPADRKKQIVELMSVFRSIFDVEITAAIHAASPAPRRRPASRTARKA